MSDFKTDMCIVRGAAIFYGDDEPGQKALLRIEARVKELEAKLAQSGLAFEDQARELENAVGLLEELGPEHALEFRRRTYPDLYPRP